MIKSELGSGKYSKIATINKGKTTSYTDTSVKTKSGKKYTCKVIPYSGKNQGTSKTKSLLRLVAPEMSSAKNTANQTVTDKGASKLTYKDKKAKKGKEYSYSVKSYNGNTTSSYASKSITVSVKK